MRGFIDDAAQDWTVVSAAESQSAFVRGFIDDVSFIIRLMDNGYVSQSAFVRGVIDDRRLSAMGEGRSPVSIRVRARLHR